MAININNNNAANWGMFQLKRTSTNLSTSLAKIASGQRINKAADDASGMIIADQLGSQARGMGQGIRNASDAINIAQIADGALGESTSIIQDIRVKALQAANGSQSVESRQAIQADINKQLETLDSIAQSTSFNGQKLLNGNFTGKQFQVGANSNETIDLSIDSAESTKLGNQENGSLADIDVTTAEGAQSAIEVVDAALSQVNTQRSNIGSTQNQLQSTINNMHTSRINALSAESTIRNIDYAEESMNLNKMQALEKSTSYGLAQAKTSSQNVMSLLGFKA